MSNTEDSSPTAAAPPRHRDWIDEMHAAVAAERARVWREENRYQVHYGPWLSHTRPFTTFARAFEFLVERIEDQTCPRLVGVGFNAERSGLTHNETAAVLAALELRGTEARRS